MFGQNQVIAFTTCIRVSNREIWNLFVVEASSVCVSMRSTNSLHRLASHWAREQQNAAPPPVVVEKADVQTDSTPPDAAIRGARRFVSVGTMKEFVQL